MFFELEDRMVTTWAPTVDVCERGGEVIVFVEVPGVDRADLHLLWRNGTLVISGQKRRQPPERGIARYLCVERAYGTFRREIAIHLPVDPDRAFARMEEGLLRIHLPRLHPPAETVIPLL